VGCAMILHILSEEICQRWHERYEEFYPKGNSQERLKGLFFVSKGVLPADYKFNGEEAHER